MSKLSEIEKVECEVGILKSEAAMRELDLKRLKLLDEIERVEAHKALQVKNIEKLKKKMEG